MGVSKARKRKLRRRFRQGTPARHALRGGRTGSVQHKNRAGALHEAKKAR